MAEKRKRKSLFCGHCNCFVSHPTFYRHKAKFYDVSKDVWVLLLFTAESLNSTISEAEVDTREYTHSEIQLTEEVWFVYNNIIIVYPLFLFTVSSRNTNRKFR